MTSRNQSTSVYIYISELTHAQIIKPCHVIFWRVPYCLMTTVPVARAKHQQLRHRNQKTTEADLRNAQKKLELQQPVSGIGAQKLPMSSQISASQPGKTLWIRRHLWLSSWISLFLLNWDLLLSQQERCTHLQTVSCFKLWLYMGKFNLNSFMKKKEKRTVYIIETLLNPYTNTRFESAWPRC